MRISLYKIRTYAQLDTWSRGTKQSQTKPISPDLPLPAQPKTSLTSFLTRPYTTTPQSQKQSQTNPISPPSQPTKIPNPPLFYPLYAISYLTSPPPKTTQFLLSPLQHRQNIVFGIIDIPSVRMWLKKMLPDKGRFKTVISNPNWRALLWI